MAMHMQCEVNISALLTDMGSKIMVLLYLSLSQQVQYAFCHEVLAAYRDKFDNYANFNDMI